jgi:hypothetical protein
MRSAIPDALKPPNVQDPRTAKTPGDKACPATAAGAARAYERSDFDSLKHRNGA